MTDGLNNKLLVSDVHYSDLHCTYLLTYMIYKVHIGDLNTELVLYLNSQKLSNRPMVRNLIQYSDHHLNTGQEKVQYSDVRYSDPQCTNGKEGYKVLGGISGSFGVSLPPLNIPLNFPLPWENSYEAPCLFQVFTVLILYLIDPCVRGIGEQSRHWPRLGPSQGPQGKQVAIPTLSWNKFKTLDRLLFVRVEIYQASKCTILIFN